MAKVPTQEFIDPKTGKKTKVSYNDKAGIELLRDKGFRRNGGINDSGCTSYSVNTKG